jgi:hypothetical protein
MKTSAAQQKSNFHITPEIVAECTSQAKALRKLLRAHLKSKHLELLKAPA